MGYFRVLLQMNRPLPRGQEEKRYYYTHIYINLNALQYTHGLHVYIKISSFFYYYILEKVMNIGYGSDVKINEIL